MNRRRPSSTGIRRSRNIPNLVLVAIWDERSQKNSASHEYGRFIVPKAPTTAMSSRARRWPSSPTNIRARVKKYASRIGNLEIAETFEANLEATIERFNGFARTGKDLDFRRGERIVELLFNGPAAESPAGPIRRCIRSATAGPTTRR